MDYLEHLRYLTRSFLDKRWILSKELSGKIYSPQASSVKLLQISGISRSWEEANAQGVTFSLRDNIQHYRTVDILTGCFGAQIPVLFLVQGFRSSVNVYLGTFAPETGTQTSRGETALEFLHRSLEAHYPGIELQNLNYLEQDLFFKASSQANHFGILTGLPMYKTTDETGNPTQIDRLIRVMRGHDWGILVLAEPLTDNAASSTHQERGGSWFRTKVSESPQSLNENLIGRTARELLNDVTKEMRGVENAEQEKIRRSPEADLYYQNLSLLAQEFQQACVTGLWRTSYYYFSPNQDSFDCLGASLCSCFGGEKSLPDPIRTIEHAGLDKIVPAFKQLLQQPPDLLSEELLKRTEDIKFKYPYLFQTLLDSIRLSGLIHLPRLEVSGFTVRDAVRFDVAAPKAPKSVPVKLGGIVDYGCLVGSDYVLSAKAIKKHALIVGVTGSGKTNTCQYLLQQLWQSRIPFLVIEPAKTEYRNLLTDPVIGSDLRVFTLGNEQGSPFRLNPFEFESGISLSSHVDLLKSVFNAAFSMWTVLPQILEQSLYEVYRQYGWDVARNENRRLLDAFQYRIDAFPTLADLQQVVTEVVDRLGYSADSNRELKAALVTRLQSLRIGGKGKMLDTRESFSMEQLLRKPTVLELEEIGDDNEKAFLIGLLLVRLYEHLRSRGLSEDKELKHVVVVEEAHRLLANVATYTPADVANTRGKAVETFVNMLSEVRAYGEGFLVAEQIPSKLSPDVIKNTNIKIVHRTVAGDDRLLMGQAMNMTQQQPEVLGTLTVGEAAVFAEGDDRPILVKVDEFPTRTPFTSKQLTPLMLERVVNQFPEVKLDCLAGCKKHTEITSYCDLAQEIAELPVFQEAISYYVLSIVETAKSATDELPKVLEKARKYYPGLVVSKELIQSLLIHGIVLHLRRWGRKYQWSFDGIVTLNEVLIPVVLEAFQSLELSSNLSPVNMQRLETFRHEYCQLCIRNLDPFPACRKVCDQQPHPLCLYRYQVGSLLQQKRLHDTFGQAIQSSENTEELLENLRNVCYSACSLCVTDQLPLDYQTQIGLCFAVQKFEEMINISPHLREEYLESLIEYMKISSEQ